jgi:hypothetical protein
MKRHADLFSRLCPGIALSMALAGAGCNAAGDTESPMDGVRPELPDLRPDVPDHVPEEDGALRLRVADNVLRQSKERGTADGGNATGVHSCLDGQPGYDHYEHGGNSDGTQLHVVGVYTSAEGASSFEPVVAPVDVTVKRDGTSVLVLSSFDQVIWNVAMEDGATLERVIVLGYEDSVVNAPEGVEVVKYKFPEYGIGYQSGWDWPSYGTTQLVDSVEILTGLELTSFRGCYGAESFEIDEPGEVRPPHAESPGTEPRILPGCEALTAESNYCMVENGYGASSYTMVGLDSGTRCGQITTNIDSQEYTEASLAWLGDYVYTCMNRGLTRISLIDGSVDIAPMLCSGVTAHDGGLLALVTFPDEADAGMYLVRFASFADAVESNPESVFAMAPWGTRMAAHGEKVFFAWHSTDTFQSAEIADGAEFQDTTLENFDDWILGMDITDDGKFVMTGWEDQINIFDVATGTFLSQIPDSNPDDRLGGIECLSGGAAK